MNHTLDMPISLNCLLKKARVISSKVIVHTWSSEYHYKTLPALPINLWPQSFTRHLPLDHTLSGSSFLSYLTTQVEYNAQSQWWWCSSLFCILQPVTVIKIIVLRVSKDSTVWFKVLVKDHAEILNYKCTHWNGPLFFDLNGICQGWKYFFTWVKMPALQSHVTKL